MLDTKKIDSFYLFNPLIPDVSATLLSILHQIVADTA